MSNSWTDKPVMYSNSSPNKVEFFLVSSFSSLLMCSFNSSMFSFWFSGESFTVEIVGGESCAEDKGWCKEDVGWDEDC